MSYQKTLEEIEHEKADEYKAVILDLYKVLMRLSETIYQEGKQWILTDSMDDPKLHGVMCRLFEVTDSHRAKSICVKEVIA